MIRRSTGPSTRSNALPLFRIISLIACLHLIRSADAREAGIQSLQSLESMVLTSMKQQFPDYFYRTNTQKLTLYTPEAFERRKVTVTSENVFEAILTEARRIDSETFSPIEKQRLFVLVYILESFVDGYKWRDYGNLNPLNFLRDNIRLGLSRPTKELLEEIPVQIHAKIALMRRAIHLNRTSHISSMAGVVDTIEMYQGIAKKMVSCVNTTKRHTNGMLVSLFNSMMVKVRQAISDLKLFLIEEYLPNTRPVAGIHYWPSGLAYYHACIRWHIGLDVTAIEIHETGLKEVERIKALLYKLIENLGFSGDLKAFHNHIHNIPRFFNHTTKYLVKRYTEVIDRRIKPRLRDFFRNISVSNVTVLPYMMSGLEAGYSQNVFFVNLERPEKHHGVMNNVTDDFSATYNMLPLALHEAIPGHHYQAEYARFYNLPKYRKILTVFPIYPAPMSFPYFTSYVEGWALYAEDLGEEMGLLENPYDRYGWYNYEMLRACRLVVDTGMHALGWSREDAIRYMMQYVDFTRKKVEVEVDRYITWPGQALGYKVGELHIKRLRQHAGRQLGVKFNVSDFHHVILRIGPVPLVMLDKVVTDWVDSVLHPFKNTSVGTPTTVSSISLIVILGLFLLNQPWN